MTIKRLILLLITILALIPVFSALAGSINQPQVQANLQLYQTNLILHASEFQINKLNNSDDLSSFDWTETRNALIGQDPYLTAEKQYKEAQKLSKINLAKLKDKLEKLSSQQVETNTKKDEINIVRVSTSNPSLKTQLETAITKEQSAINKLDLKLGILEIQRGKLATARETWDQLIKQKNIDVQPTAIALNGLWSEPAQVLSDAETQIKEHLDGWFRYRALAQFYQIEDRQADLLALENKEQEIAVQSILKLAFVGAIPVLGGIIGFALLIFLLVQLFLKKEKSLLGSLGSLSWETPWNVETIWQVLIVGFFFIGQIILPLLFGVVKLDPTALSLRGKAIYVLVTYLLMAASGLLVLYFSIKPFFPLPKDWFRFQWLSNWVLWGIGGYLVALPLVVVISLINQLFWNGQGGSNPLLFLALKAQDKVVLAIFFFTASIAAPFFEEIIFRGFLLPSLTRYFPVWGAISISSLVFALAHLNLSEVLPLATLGMILGFVYTRSRSLLSSILLHSLWNSGTLLSLFILGSGTG